MKPLVWVSSEPDYIMCSTVLPDAYWILFASSIMQNYCLKLMDGAGLIIIIIY